ncbi:MAG: 4Fe-4S dicluster domain-containing protein [Promethearchaeota archaeon]
MSENGSDDISVVLNLNKRSDELLKEIESHPLAGNDYFSCIGCGRCVGSCPASSVSINFNIRQFNRRIIEGDESIFEDPAIWDCFYCQTCTGLCPRENIDGYKTIIILRDIALQKGYGVGHLSQVIPIMFQFIEKGVLTDGETWLDVEAIEEIKKISEMSGLLEHLNNLKSKLEKLG